MEMEGIADNELYLHQFTQWALRTYKGLTVPPRKGFYLNVTCTFSTYLLLLLSPEWGYSGTAWLDLLSAPAQASPRIHQPPPCTYKCCHLIHENLPYYAPDHCWAAFKASCQSHSPLDCISTSYILIRCKYHTCKTHWFTCIHLPLFCFLFKGDFKHFP